MSEVEEAASTMVVSEAELFILQAIIKVLALRIVVIGIIGWVSKSILKVAGINCLASDSKVEV